MYKVKPIESKFEIKNQSNIMYKTKSYFNENELNFDLSNQLSNLSLNANELDELNRQQNKQLRRLERLLNKSNELCDDLRLDNLVLTNVKLFNKQTSNEQSKLEDIYNKQEAQFKKIEQLTARLNQINKDLASVNLNKSTNTVNKPQREKLNVDLNQFKSINRVNTKVNKEKSIVEDFVFNLSPENVPFELFNYLDLLTTLNRCFVKFHIHGSVSNELNSNLKLENRVLSVIELFDALNLGVNESRNNYDFGFTFIWKKLNDGNEPELSSTNGSVVRGESNIIKVLNDLLKQNKIQDNLVKNRNSSPLLKLLKSF